MQLGQPAETCPLFPKVVRHQLQQDDTHNPADDDGDDLGEAEGGCRIFVTVARLLKQLLTTRGVLGERVIPTEEPY